ncbi:hypothetical protein TNCV_2773441 [Trichonephila clavipes]|nr:hypothetical protein TNCV_2773441 [Trichonephila clavipes]
MAPQKRRIWGKNYLLTIAIPDYRPSIENVELSSPVQHNASSDKNSRTTVMVSFLDVTGIKPCPDLSKSKCVENRFWMIYRSTPAVVVLGRPPPTFLTAEPMVWNAFLSARNDTFVDSKLCSYTCDGTPPLQLSDHSSTEILEVDAGDFF